MDQGLLLDLTPELLDDVLKSLSVRDITNLQCCNSIYYNALRCYTWKTVRIRLHKLSKQNLCLRKRRLDNLIFTKTLCLGDKDPNENASINDKVVADNYQTILQHSNPITLRLGPWLKSCELPEHVRCICEMTNLTNLHIRGLAGLWTYRGVEKYGSGYVKSICDCLPQLKGLRLYCLALRDVDLAHLHQLHNLEELDISYNGELTDASLHTISMLRKLKVLEIKCCVGFTEQGFCHFRNTVLKKFDVSFCHYGNKRIMQIAKFTNLRILQLGMNNCHDIALKSIGKLENLTCLELVEDYFLTDEGLAYLAPLHNLNYLVVRDMGNITGKGFPLLKSLRTLEISDCNVNDDGAWFIAQNNSLKFLNLNSNYPLSNKGYVYLCNLQNLVHLNIGSCIKIFDRALSDGDKLNIPPALKRLKVSDTQISYKCASYINEQTSIEIMMHRKKFPNYCSAVNNYREISDPVKWGNYEVIVGCNCRHYDAALAEWAEDFQFPESVNS